MENSGVVPTSPSLSWRALLQKIAPRGEGKACVHVQGLWRRIRNRPPLVRVQGSWYCLPHCLEGALIDAVRRTRPTVRRPAILQHRLPLGLLLLSRQQLTAGQLRAALDAQQSAGRGRIGDWFQEMGFVTEQQVTAALGRQWSCPVLRSAAAVTTGLSPFLSLPLRLLESFQMIPADFVETTQTLHIAFSDGINYTVLYAIEQMLGCHTAPCLVCPSALRKQLMALAQHGGSKDATFDRVADPGEFARIVRSYAASVEAAEVRLVACGEHIWVRLERQPRPPVSLVLNFPLY
jgi:hypothetical protein